MNRREWMSQVAGIGAGAAVASAAGLLRADEPALPEPTPAHLPRWRGFNLLSKFNLQWSNGPFPEEDFAIIQELGFDFVRLPLDYRCWIEGGDPNKFKESALKEIDDAVEFGRKHGIHVQINFHRAPGYTVADPPEPRRLWSDPEILETCARHWAHFARRYQGIPNRQVSFNLFNEPDNRVQADEHRRVVEHVLAAIRKEDPKRLVVCDGRAYGRIAPTELLGLDIAAAGHCYDPHRLTHYRASWVRGSDRWPAPTWPLQGDGPTWDSARIVKERIQPLSDLRARGMGAYFGEFGCHNRTPHGVALAWMKDVLDAFKAADFGWALWNLRGSFGILDSERQDVNYETWKGHQLDRKMLELLQAA